MGTPKISVAEMEAKYVAREKDISGSGAALHTHPTEEVFVPLRGTCEVVWLEGEDERAVQLGPLDVVHVPVGVYRGFRLISGEADALMLAIVGGPEAGNVGWHPA